MESRLPLKPMSREEIDDYKARRIEDGKPLSKADLLELHSRRTSVEEETAKTIESFDTGLSTEDIKLKLEKLKIKDIALKAAILVAESPEFQALKETLDIAVEAVRELTVKQARAIEVKFKVQEKYSEKIRKLKEQLSDAEKQFHHELTRPNNELESVKKEKASAMQIMRVKAADLIKFCRSKELDPTPYLLQFFANEPPSLRIRKLAEKAVEEKVEVIEFPSSWFVRERSMRWSQWKDFIKDKEVIILSDTSKVDNYKVLSGPEAKVALSKCRIKYNKEILT